jgi:predicted transcriptional regulator with HTH domain
MEDIMTLDDLQINSRSAIEILYKTILELLKMYPNGLTNSEIARKLELESSHENAQHDYLSYSLLGNMMKGGLIKKMKIKNKVLYTLS